MAEAEILQTEEGDVVRLEEKQLPATEEASIRVLYTPTGEEKHENESESVTQPLLQHKHQDSRDEDDKADAQASTDGAGRKTPVPQELESAGGGRPGCGGSAGSLCSNDSRHECPICSEPLDGDHLVTVLNCDHALCHNCTAGIMRRAKDPGRLQCPFCRQTTPLPQWEIRRMQEESYSDAFYEPAPDFVISPGPELEAAGCCVCPSCLVRGLSLMRLHSLGLSITVLLLLVVVLLGYFLYSTVVPLIMLTMIFSDG